MSSSADDNPLISKLSKSKGNLLKAFELENLDLCAQHITEHNRKYPKTWIRTSQGKCLEKIEQIKKNKANRTNARNNIYCIYGRYTYLKNKSIREKLGLMINTRLDLAEMNRRLKIKNLTRDPEIIYATAVYWCLGRAVLCNT